MTKREEPANNDHGAVWSEGSWRFTSAEHLSQLWPGARFTDLGAEPFKATVWRRSLPQSRLEGIAATPYRMDRDGGLVRKFPADVTTVNVVIQGEVHLVDGEQELTAREGDVFLHRGSAFFYECRSPSITFRSATPSHLLLGGTDRDLRPFSVRPRSVLTSSFTRFAHEALRSVATGRHLQPRAARQLEVALLVLQRSVIEEALIPASPTSLGDSSTQLRSRVLDFVELHLFDRDLGPQRIADVLQVSRRWLFKAFEDQPEGLAAHIRRRRIESATSDLHLHPDLSLSELARRHGFAGPDQFRRAFQSHHHAGPTEYRTGVALGGEATGSR